MRAVAISILLAALSSAALGQCGQASWYGTEFCVSNPCKTASGERYTGRDMTAAMMGSHIGEKYRVTYKGKSVVVRINDTGDFAKYGRIIDLSEAAAKKIGLKTGPRSGTGKVCLERVS